MSEEEVEYYDQFHSEEEYEEEVVVQEEVVKVPKRPPSVGRDRLETTYSDSLTEAEQAMIAAKRRQEEDDIAKLQDYEERRRTEREREEEEIRVLRERQEQRRVMREEEERTEQERRVEREERRKQEELERRARIEEERRIKKEEKERKRQQMLSMTTGVIPGGRNFVLPEKRKDHSDKFGNIVQAKHEMSLTKEQRETAKNNFLAQIERALGELNLLSGHDLRGKIKEMHQRICKLETEKYDLEKRVQSQEYDLKELNERQRQLNRTKNLKNRGTDDTGGRYPPKIPVVSKYDRQIDRRNFGERRQLYDKKHAFPCFPNVGPPPTILEFKLKPDATGSDHGNEEEYAYEAEGAEITEEEE